MDKKITVLKELQGRYVDELLKPSKWGYNKKTEKYEENAVCNKTRLKRLRLQMHEIMMELEGEM